MRNGLLIFRRSKDLTLGEMARMTGISIVDISSIERGYPATRYQAQLMADALEIAYEQLITLLPTEVQG